MKNKRIIIGIVAVIFSCSLVLNGLLIMRGGYYNIILAKLGIKEQAVKTDWTLVGWERSLDQLNCDADIVFYGDSLTSGGNFQEHFPDWKIVNLGIPGDSLLGMKNRAKMLSSVTPEKIFIMGGINSLTDKNSDSVFQDYKNMLNAVLDAVPDAQIYIESILPISLEKEKECADNSVIAAFNQRLESLALEKNITYIDLYSLYVLNGEMNPELTKDGVHLQPSAYEYWFCEIQKYVDE